MTVTRDDIERDCVVYERVADEVIRNRARAWGLTQREVRMSYAADPDGGIRSELDEWIAAALKETARRIAG